MASSRGKPKVATLGPFINVRPFPALMGALENRSVSLRSVKVEGPVEKALKTVAGLSRLLYQELDDREMLHRTVWGRIEDAFDVLYHLRVQARSDQAGLAMAVLSQEEVDVEKVAESLNPPLGALIFPLFGLAAMKAWAVGALLAQWGALRKGITSMEALVEGLGELEERAVDVVETLSSVCPGQRGILSLREELKEQVIIYKDRVIKKGRHAFVVFDCGRDCLSLLLGLTRPILSSTAKELDFVIKNVWRPFTHPFAWAYTTHRMDDREAYRTSKELFTGWVRANSHLLHEISSQRHG